MEALLAEIKSTVANLENDNEPEELRMRACMGKTVKLMKDLRNTIVESGQYSELIKSRTSKVLAECRTLMGFLYRSVPCHAEGGKVPPEAHRCFLQVMDVVIGQFDDIIKESLNKQNSGDPDPQSQIQEELKEVIYQNLERFKKLTASAIKASKRSRQTECDLENELSFEHLECELELQEIKAQDEQPKAFQKSSQPELDVSRRDRGDAMDIHSPNLKNSHLSPLQIPDCRPEEMQLEHLPHSEEEQKKGESTEGRPYLPAQTRVIPSDFILKDQSEQESNVEIVDSQQKVKSQTSQRTESQDLQVLGVQKEQTMCNSSDIILKGQTELESNVEIVDSQQNIKDQTSLRMESQDLRVLWVQKEKTKYNSSEFILKDQSELKSNVSMVGSNPDLQVLWVRKEQPLHQTSSTSSDFICEDQPQSSQDFQVLLDQNDSSIIEKSLSSSGIESLENVPVLKVQGSNMACSGSLQNHISLLRTTREDLPFSSVQEDKPLIHTSFTSPGFLLKDVLHPENYKISACLTSERSQDQQEWARTDNSMVKMGSSSSDFSIKETNSCIKNIKSRQIDNPLTQNLISSNVTPRSPISAEIPSVSDAQPPLTRQQRNRNYSIKKPKLSPKSFFAVGKTFGDTRLRLLRWCQERTRKYGLPMYEFSESWRSGRALVALIASYHKDLIEERFLNKESPRSTLTYGATIAKSLGVDSAVDIVQVCRQKVPDFCKVCEFVANLERCLVPGLE